MCNKSAHQTAPVYSSSTGSAVNGKMMKSCTKTVTPRRRPPPRFVHVRDPSENESGSLPPPFERGPTTVSKFTVDEPSSSNRSTLNNRVGTHPPTGTRHSAGHERGDRDDSGGAVGSTDEGAAEKGRVQGEKEKAGGGESAVVEEEGREVTTAISSFDDPEVRAGQENIGYIHISWPPKIANTAMSWLRVFG